MPAAPFEAFGRTHELVVGASKRIYDMTTHSYSPYDLNWPINAGKPNFTHTNNVREVTTQDGFYLTSRLSLADPLKLILGARLDWYDYDNRDAAGDYKVTRNLTRYAGLIYDLDDQQFGIRELQRHLHAAKGKEHSRHSAQAHRR